MGRITPVRSFAFPPQGEGGPLCVPCGYAVDEVPERSEAFFVPYTKRTSSVIRLAGDGGCHLPRARGRLGHAI